MNSALRIAEIRRRYFVEEMDRETREPAVTRDNIPTFGDDLEGIHYLPRLLAKARAKLRGELDPDLMYACGGDRKFLRENGDIHPADFLQRVWETDGDDTKVAEWIRSLS